MDTINNLLEQILKAGRDVLHLYNSTVTPTRKQSKEIKRLTNDFDTKYHEFLVLEAALNEEQRQNIRATASYKFIRDWPAFKVKLEEKSDDILDVKVAALI